MASVGKRTVKLPKLIPAENVSLFSAMGNQEQKFGSWQAGFTLYRTSNSSLLQMTKADIAAHD
ncbi:hypothetical protein NIES4101_37690 [Calothrix sp. NIES-4101]|nr:hypothetical protein NIES4101_37690 [Calothrix sp. NIES-4101]